MTEFASGSAKADGVFVIFVFLFEGGLAREFTYTLATKVGERRLELKHWAACGCCEICGASKWRVLVICICFVWRRGADKKSGVGSSACGIWDSELARMYEELWM